MAEQANDRFEGFKFYLCNAQHHPQWILCSLRCGSTEQEEISTTCRKKARSKHTHKAKTQVEEKHIQATPIILRMQIVKREKSKYAGCAHAQKEKERERIVPGEEAPSRPTTIIIIISLCTSAPRHLQPYRSATASCLRWSLGPCPCCSVSKGHSGSPDCAAYSCSPGS